MKNLTKLSQFIAVYKFISLLLLLCVSFACNHSTDEVEVSQYRLSSMINFVPAKTNSELRILTENTKFNILRDLSQVNNLINLKITPLNKVPENELKEFVSTLYFNNNGIASIQYGIIKKHLSTEDYNIVMALFGLDVKEGFWGNASSPKSNPNARPSVDDEGTDYKDYKCTARKTCQYNIQYICTSNC